MDQENKERQNIDEIDIMSWIKAIKKRRKTVYVFFLGGLFIGLCSFYFLPNLYIAQSVIEIGLSSDCVSSYCQNYNYLYHTIEDPLDLAEKVKNGSFGDYKGLTAYGTRGAKTVLIEVKNKDPKISEEMVNELSAKILFDHAQRLNLVRSDSNSKEVEINKTIEELKKDIYYLGAQGQQIANLKEKIYDLQFDVKDIQKRISGLRETVVLKTSVSLGNKLNLAMSLIFGGFLGIFLGIFSSFFGEWWLANKGKI